jgi:para-aminobenzoate synthetase component 1
MSGKSTIKEQMNEWAGAGIPFLFIIDFEQLKPLAFRLDEINPENLLYDINGITNCHDSPAPLNPAKLVKYPEAYADYLVKFNKVKDEIANGNTFLLNLTCSTPVDLNSTLAEIFHMSSARYKIWFDDQFVCFSPESFVIISNGMIRSFPMKGTIDADSPDAENVILNDPKETAEHYTIVDLIRNDLSMVSKRVRVGRFRYFDTLKTNEKRLLQVSSEVCGELDVGYASSLGDIIFTLLPAGSVSGAPKKKTTEIIASAEGMTRGYYTGVAGIFDGRDLNSFVMIRFIEKRDDSYFYRSGGGITSFSDPLSEYNEMIDKIYVPVI